MQQEVGESSWFAFGLVMTPKAKYTRVELVKALQAHGVECRPIEAGNMAQQPAMKALTYRAGPLPNAEYIHRNSFFWGNNHGIGETEREAVATYVHEFMGRQR